MSLRRNANTPPEVVACTGQNKVQLMLQPEPHQHVLDGAAGALVGLQEGDLGLLGALPVAGPLTNLLLGWLRVSRPLEYFVGQCEPHQAGHHCQQFSGAGIHLDFNFTHSSHTDLLSLIFMCQLRVGVG